MSIANQSWELMSGLAKGLPWGRLPLQQLVADLPRVRKEFLAFLQNGGRMVAPTTIVEFNFDTDPHIPDGWSIHEEDQIDSRLTGTRVLDLSKIDLHLDSGQQGNKRLSGHELKKRLEGQPVLPAHVLDYLYENLHLIPDSWKRKFIFFWGTVYRGSGGRLCVHYLGWNGLRWYCNYVWLDGQWNLDSSSAVSAS
jgi:hypothetical protein